MANSYKQFRVTQEVWALRQLTVKARSREEAIEKYHKALDNFDVYQPDDEVQYPQAEEITEQ
jgi:hypothetical protein